MPVKYWSQAGLMLTDWCPGACASCYLRCSPAGRQWMSVEFALDTWLQLDALCPHRCRVHITGGEPFGDWPRLLKIARLAKERSLLLDKVETNAYWATDEDVVRQRLEALDEAGMKTFAISADPFHQQFVPIEAPRLAWRVAVELLGPQRVQVRWEDWLGQGQGLAEATDDERNAIFAEWMSRRRDRVHGRAAESLAGYLPLRPVEEFAGLHCRQALLRGKQIHVSPEGLIAPGVCAGISLGLAGLEPVGEIWQNLYDAPVDKPVISALAQGGPVALMSQAVEIGFVPAAGYASKCHLCWAVRKFLHAKPGPWSNELAPATIYENHDETFLP